MGACGLSPDKVTPQCHCLPGFTGDHCESTAPSDGPVAPGPNPPEVPGVAHHLVIFSQPSSTHNSPGALVKQPIVRVVDFEGKPVSGTYHIDAVAVPAPIYFDAEGAHVATNDFGSVSPSTTMLHIV